MIKEKTNAQEQMGAYAEAVKSGLYAKKSGLTGKYDNVRRYWEDEITREALRPHITKLLKYCQDKLRRLRIMDLGCGSADGFELLSGVRYRDPDLHQREVRLITPEVLGTYMGVDFSEDLLGQADEIYGHHPKMRFRQGDFTQTPFLEKGERPYDFYFTSFGTCSHHNDDDTMVELLAELAGKTEEYCLITCDWLGRYSYEWQNLWVRDPGEVRNMDYVISYIYEKEERERRRDELEHLTLRLMSRSEVDEVVRRAEKKAGVKIKPLKFYDRSTFTGRHIDTGDYNQGGLPIRGMVNSLHETNERTELEALKVNYVPKSGFDFLNDYFEHLQVCWNTLVNHVEILLEIFDEESNAFRQPVPAPPPNCPKPLENMMKRMERVVEGTGWLTEGLPRENMIEPQLGYALRDLVMQTQTGKGCGHGLVGIFEIDKR